MKPRKPLPKRNPARRARAFAKAYGSVDRVAFVKRLPCSVLGCLAKPCENAHVGRHAGMGLKGEAETVIPLCAAHHKEYHDHGRDTFAAKYKLDYAYHAHLTELAWSMANPEEK